MTGMLLSIPFVLAECSRADGGGTAAVIRNYILLLSHHGEAMAWQVYLAIARSSLGTAQCAYIR